MLLPDGIPDENAGREEEQEADTEEVTCVEPEEGVEMELEVTADKEPEAESETELLTGKHRVAKAKKKLLYNLAL